MIPFLRKHEIWIFLLLLVVVNAIFVTSVVEGILPVGVYSHGRFLLLASVLFGLVFLVRRKEGLIDLLKPMIEWRRSPRASLTWPSAAARLSMQPA